MLKSESQFLVGKIKLLVKTDDKVPVKFNLIRKLLSVCRYMYMYYNMGLGISAIETVTAAKSMLK